MKIIDCFLYFNEQDLLEERISILSQHVDLFIILEFGKTFSGIRKDQSIDLSFVDEKSRSKIIYRFIENEDCIQSNDTLARTNWDQSLIWKHNGKKPRELEKSNQREIKHRDALAGLIYTVAETEDVIMISDIDEIPKPKVVQDIKLNYRKYLDKITYIKMDWRIYFSDYNCDSSWFGTYITSLSLLKLRSIDELRVSSPHLNNPNGQVVIDGGIHLSYLGGIASIKSKLEALGHQGFRAKFTKLLVCISPKLSLFLLRNGYDLLLQRRNLQVVPIDENHFISNSFLKKYSIVNHLRQFNR